MTKMHKYKVDEHIDLRICRTEDAEELFGLIDENRTQMEQFMTWARGTKKAADEERFLKYCQQQFEEHKLWPATILVDGKPAGMFDFHNIDHDNQHCEIGYWLGKDFQHNGVMMKVVRRATEIGFDELQMHKIVIMAVTENTASQNVALKAGYSQEAILKEYLLGNGLFHDAVLYSQTSKK